MTATLHFVAVFNIMIVYFNFTLHTSLRLEPTHLFGLPQLLVFDTGKGCHAVPLHVYGPPGLG